MSKPFPDTDFLSGNFGPWPIEGECHDLAVVGEIPRELRGAYYRNGPNPQYAPRGSYHWFDGDGMIHGFFFEDGRCSYRNRWVRTARWQLEREHGESLFGGLADGSIAAGSIAVLFGCHTDRASEATLSPLLHPDSYQLGRPVSGSFSGWRATCWAAFSPFRPHHRDSSTGIS